MAFFDAKYGDLVRVVCMGDISKEFCGGTHVSNTREIGCFTIAYEESIAAGVRRIEGRTSLASYDILKQKEVILNSLQNLVKATSYAEVVTRVSSLL